MRELFILVAHLLTMLVRLARPGGVSGSIEHRRRPSFGGCPIATAYSSYLPSHSVTIRLLHGESTLTALSIARAGGAVGRVGVPQETSIPAGIATFFANVTIVGGPAPVRAYMEEFLPDVHEGRIQPGRVFDRVTTLDGVPDGYRAMNDREAIKVMIRF